MGLAWLSQDGGVMGEPETARRPTPHTHPGGPPRPCFLLQWGCFLPSRASLQRWLHTRSKLLREGGGKQLRRPPRAGRSCLRADIPVLREGAGRRSHCPLPGIRRPGVRQRQDPYQNHPGGGGLSPKAVESKLDSLPALPQTDKVKTLW